MQDAGSIPTLNPDTPGAGSPSSDGQEVDFDAALAAALDEPVPLSQPPARVEPASEDGVEALPRDIAASLIEMFDLDSSKDTKNTVDFVLGKYPAKAFLQINSRLLMQIGFDFLRETKLAMRSARLLSADRKEIPAVRINAGKNIIAGAEVFAKVATAIQVLAEKAVDKVASTAPPPRPRNLPPMLVTGGNVQVVIGGAGSPPLPPSRPLNSSAAIIDTTAR